MNTSTSDSTSIGLSGSASVGNESAGANIDASIGIDVGYEAHLQADNTGISAGAEYHEQS